MSTGFVRGEFRVLLDANHGSGSVLGRPLLERLGCECDCCWAASRTACSHMSRSRRRRILATVLTRVTRAGADVGFCQDPDADRLAIIDENGRYIGEEYTLAIVRRSCAATARRGRSSRIARRAE